MSFSTLPNCAFPQDLDATSYALLQELATRANDVLNDLKNIANQAEIENLNRILDTGLGIMDQMLIIGGATAKDLESAVRLPPDQPSDADLEKYLGCTNLKVNGGFIFAPATEVNLVPLKRLYTSFDANLAKTKSVLSEYSTGQALFSVGVILTKIIAKQSSGNPLTIKELREFAKIPALKDENVSVLHDGSQLLVYRQHLDINKSLDGISSKYGVNKKHLTPFVLHFKAVNNSVPAIQRYQNLGYSGDALTAILTPSDYQEVSTDPLSITLKNCRQQATSIVNNINFFLISFDSQTSAGLDEFRKSLTKNLNVLKDLHQQLIAESYFFVSTLVDTTLLDSLSKVQTDLDLNQLFLDRDDINGVNLEASDQDKLKILQTVLSDTVGSVKISSACLNKETTPVLYSKKLLTVMMSYVVDAMLLNEDKKVSNDKRLGQFFFNSAYLTKIRDLIVNYLQEEPVTVEMAGQIQASGVVNVGYETYNSASSALIQVVDLNKTFNSVEKLNNLQEASKDLPNYFPPAVAQVMKAIIDFLTNIFSNAFSILNRLMVALRGPLMALKNKLDNFMSKLNALLGNGNLEVSILGCKLGANVSLSFGLLDDLLSLLFNMQDLFNSFISKLLKFCADLLEKLICYPTKLLNSIIPSELAGLPLICNTGLPFTFAWPKNVLDALQKLKEVPDAYSVTFNSLSADLIKANLSLNVFPEKINQFKLASFCENSLFGSFSNAANLNYLSASAGLNIANPLAGLQTSVFGPAGSLGALKGFGL
jgi:hypothetical protein